ncbi:MAG: hypothetical protein QG610_1198 [Euryarchaeota archaeon]|nr:hypothetical protein [Euryarchaeota archaeon]
MGKVSERNYFRKENKNKAKKSVSFENITSAVELLSFQSTQNCPGKLIYKRQLQLINQYFYNNPASALTPLHVTFILQLIQYKYIRY